MLGQPRPQQHNENLTLNRSSQLHQVTAATPAKGRRQRPIADSGRGARYMPPVRLIAQINQL